MGTIELDGRRIRRRLEGDGWFLLRQTGPHDIYMHPSRKGRIIVPRHRGDLDFGLARTLARQAGWI